MTLDLLQWAIETERILNGLIDREFEDLLCLLFLESKNVPQITRIALSKKLIQEVELRNRLIKCTQQRLNWQQIYPSIQDHLNKLFEIHNIEIPDTDYAWYYCSDKSDHFICEPKQPSSDAIPILTEDNKYEIIVVVEKNKPVGIINFVDLHKIDKNNKKQTVKDICSDNMVILDGNMLMEQVYSQWQNSNHIHSPFLVIDTNGHFIGVITNREITRWHLTRDAKS